jgi:hypothetical protein
MNTAGNSSPFAECSVINVTRASASFSSSTSLMRATPSRKPSSVGSASECV